MKYLLILNQLFIIIEKSIFFNKYFIIKNLKVNFCKSFLIQCKFSFNILNNIKKTRNVSFKKIFNSQQSYLESNIYFERIIKNYGIIPLKKLIELIFNYYLEKCKMTLIIRSIDIEYDVFYNVN